MAPGIFTILDEAKCRGSEAMLSTKVRWEPATSISTWCSSRADRMSADHQALWNFYYAYLIAHTPKLSPFQMAPSICAMESLHLLQKEAGVTELREKKTHSAKRMFFENWVVTKMAMFIS